jgi:DNA-binding SARP family transcriptional activator
LTDICRAALIVVVEASAGYGKSVLGAELVDVWGAVPIHVLLEEGGVSGQLLTGRLRAAVSAAGFSDAAGAMVSVGEDPPGAVDAMLEALRGEACAIVIDDAHHASRDAGVLLDRIASRLTPPQRLVVLARHLPPGSERLRRADALKLSAADLALRENETLELCRSGFGIDASDDDVRALEAATAGWTAAVVLAASQARQTDQALLKVAQAGTHRADAVAAILDELLVALGERRRLLARLAPLPLIDADVATAVSGEEGFFDEVGALGLPLAPEPGGWWSLPGAVRDHLATLAPADPDSRRRAAEVYERRGQLGPALQLLLGAEDGQAAAALLAGADPRHVDALDTLELLSVIDRIPGRLLDRHPFALVHAARSCGFSALLERRSKLLARLQALLQAHEQPELERAVQAELATDLVMDLSDTREAEAIAEAVLEDAEASEQLTRARALAVLGRATAWHRDDRGRLSAAAMREAAAYLESASDIFVSLGMSAAAARLTPYRAVWIEYGLGRAQRALEILNEGLALAAGRPQGVAYVLGFRAQVLVWLGRYDEADSDMSEVLRIARQISDPAQLTAYTYWNRVLSTSFRGDKSGTLENVRLVELHRGDWWEVAGQDFLAEAADCLDRVGYAALAWDYLARARETHGDADGLVAMAECALHARHGDPARARHLLQTVEDHGIPPRDAWRVTMLTAYAASRQGDPSAGALAARAIEQAARLGLPQLPLVRERELTEALLALAIETGSPAAAALEVSSLPVALAVLGRFELTRGGRLVVIGAGQAAQLLKLIAVSGGRIAAEQAIEALWPDVAPAAGRNRLRTVLGRLREAAGDVVTRDGELLVLDQIVRLDLEQFQREAREALALGPVDPTSAVASARSAIARYRGELLPSDPYDDWLQEPREAAAQTMLDLLELCAAAAAERGDLDEVRRMVLRTIELAPYDETRYLRAAAILHEQGRRGAALSVLRRARGALTQLGVPPPRQLVELEDLLAA